MKMMTVGPTDAIGEFRSQLRAAASVIKRARLALLYIDSSSDLDGFLRVAKEEVSCPLVGCTTGGASFTERGSSLVGASLALIGGDDVDVQVSIAHDVTTNDQVVDALKHLNWDNKRSKSLMALFDPYAFDGEVLVDTLRKHVPITCHIFGASAGASVTQMSAATLFAGTERVKRGIILLAFSTDLRVRGGVRHGWVASSPQHFVITKSQGNVIFTLDNRPALQVYMEAMAKLGNPASGEGPTALRGPVHLLGVKTLYSTELKVRAPIAMSPENGTITLAGSVQQGSHVMLVTATPDKLIEAADGISKAVVGPDTNGLLVFDCMARLSLLGARYPEQVEAFRARPDLPVLGLASFGEIARFAGQLEGFHNSTAVLAGLS